MDHPRGLPAVTIFDGLTHLSYGPSWLGEACCTNIGDAIGRVRDILVLPRQERATPFRTHWAPDARCRSEHQQIEIRNGLQ